MKRLKNKTSRFFSEAPTADERAAIADEDGGLFDAGIGDAGSAQEPGMKKKSMCPMRGCAMNGRLTVTQEACGV
jgi:hypothetical protein